jgi:hypothetical protein
MNRIVGKEIWLPMALGALSGIAFILTEASAAVVYLATMIVAGVSAFAYYGFFDRLLPPRWRRR